MALEAVGIWDEGHANYSWRSAKLSGIERSQNGTVEVSRGHTSLVGQTGGSNAAGLPDQVRYVSK